MGCVTCGTRLQALCGPLNRLDELGALSPEDSAQTQLRKVGGPRHADLGVGGDQILLRRADIGTPFQQRRRQPGGNLGRRSCAVRILSARHVAGVLAQQEADLILGLLDLLLNDGDGLGRGVHQLLRLAQVEQRRDAAGLPRLGQIERFLRASRSVRWEISSS